MKSFIAILAALCLCEARPQFHVAFPKDSTVKSVGSHIIGGSNASPGEFPWQLSQQRQGGTWSHSCGASLLSATRALSAAHCVDGVLPGNVRVIAGLHQQNDLSGTQIANAASLTVHGDYGTGTASYSNDIAIINLASSISQGGNVQYATLPANNNNNYAGVTCELSGWGRTDATNNLPNTLQKTSIPVITTNQCDNAMSGVGGANVWDNHICVQDPQGNTGACNGDSGGPLNCPDGGTRVVGVTSWVVSSGLGACLPAYPSVYTRVGSYLAWINNNM
jgi:elastase-2